MIQRHLVQKAKQEILRMLGEEQTEEIMTQQFDIDEIKSIIETVRTAAKNAGYDYPPVNSVCDEIIRQLEKKSKKEQEA